MRAMFEVLSSTLSMASVVLSVIGVIMVAIMDKKKK